MIPRHLGSKIKQQQGPPEVKNKISMFRVNVEQHPCPSYKSQYLHTYVSMLDVN